MNRIVLTFLLLVALLRIEYLSAQTPIIINQDAKYPFKELIIESMGDISYVFLETRQDNFVVSENLLNGIWIFKDYIFFNAGRNNIFQFGLNGKFYGTLGAIGRGPGESINSTNLFVDEPNDEIYVPDLSLRKVIVYNSDRKVIREIPTSNFSLYPTDLFMPDILLGLYDTQPYSDIKPKSGRYFVEFSLKEQRIINRFGPYLNKVHSGGGGNSSIVRLNDQFIISSSESDTIYSLNRDRVYKPLYVHRYKNKRWAKTPYYEAEKFSLLRLSTITPRSNPQPGERRYLVTKRDLFIDKQSGNIYETALYIKKDFTEPLQTEMLFYCGKKNHAACLIPALQLIDLLKKGKIKDPSLKKRVSLLNENSNPVLVIVKFRE